MNNLKKLALATAVASAPFAVNALEALDDEFLSDVSGQEGITIDQTYLTTIEEFQYVDADGSDGTEGRIAITDITMGNLGTDASGNPAWGQISITDQRIDAAANGVLISSGNIGAEALTIDDTVAGLLTGGAADANTYAQSLGLEGADSAGNILTEVPDGAGGTVMVDLSTATGGLISANAQQLKVWGDGLDTQIGGIKLGDANGDLNSIGSVTLLNNSNYFTSGQILGALNTHKDKFGVIGVDASGNLNQAGALFNNNANRYIQGETLISSQVGRTGVTIETEGGSNVQAAYYTDTDSAGANSVGVVGLSTFRITATNELSAAHDTDNGTFLRGTYSKFDLNVENGKVVLGNQIDESSVIVNAIGVGTAEEFQNGTIESFGSIAILGQRRVGSTSIYAH